MEPSLAESGVLSQVESGTEPAKTRTEPSRAELRAKPARISKRESGLEPSEAEPYTKLRAKLAQS